MKRHLLYAIAILLLVFSSGVKGQTITGPSVVCAGSSYTYTLTGTTATSFTWIVPTGATGSSTSNTITISITSSFQSAPLSVSWNGGTTANYINLANTSNVIPTGTTPVLGGGTYVYSVSKKMG